MKGEGQPNLRRRIMTDVRECWINVYNDLGRNSPHNYGVRQVCRAYAISAANGQALYRIHVIPKPQRETTKP